MVAENQLRKNSYEFRKSSKENVEYDTKPASFEHAISATGYGTFNVLVLLANIFPSLVQVLESANLSYVVPIAHCDLGLSLEDKGMLNASCFIGMIVSGFFWGYLCDALGRKKIIVYGYLVESALVFISAFSTSHTYLMVAKFLSGLILNGPYSASISHLTEFHSSEYRSRIQLIRGLIMGACNVVLPILAWGILPREWAFSLASFDFHSWNIFMLVCALMPFLTGIVYIFLPESPKYLMTIGKNDEALMVLKKVYSMNTNRNGNDFPIKSLQQETVSQSNSKRSTTQALHEGLIQMKPLAQSPYGPLILLACFNAFTTSGSTNTLKLWLPQIFQSISDYTASHNSTSSLCTMLESLTPGNTTDSEICTVNLDNTSVYTNSVTVSLVRMVAFFLTVFLNLYFETKHIAIVLAFGNGIVSGSLYFAQNNLTVLILSSLVSGLGSLVDTILVNITLELFPTTLRTVAVSLHFMASRMGILVGNIAIPYLFHAGCAPPFLFISIMGLCCGVFSFFYPKTDNKPLL